MGSKSKVIIVCNKATIGDEIVRVRGALEKEFPQFTFTSRTDEKLGDVIEASGEAWALPANQRPAMGTMSAWAGGYVRAIEDR